MKRKSIGDYKNISVHKSTHKELASYGTKDETFDEIVKKVLKIYKKYKDVNNDDSWKEQEVDLVFSKGSK
jgi:hypothetical protein